MLHKSPEVRCPSPPESPPCDLGEGHVEGGAVVQDGDTNMEFGDLTVEVARTDAARQALGSASWSLHGYVGDTLSIVARWFARRVLMYA